MRCDGRPADRPVGPVGIDDNIVTRFCEVVTPRDIAAKLRRARFATNEMGEAMAPASESPPSGGIRSGAGAAPVFGWLGQLWRWSKLGLCSGAVLAACATCAACGACGDDARPRPRPAE